MKCLETRVTPEGFKRRRYEVTKGVRHTTIEVPIELWQAVNATSTARARAARERAAQAQRKLERESARRQVLMLAAHGENGHRIAQRLNLPQRTVYRWIKEEAK
jgi:transcriptional regulator with PAS, ATPase and Fis domain